MMRRRAKRVWQWRHRSIAVWTGCDYWAMGRAARVYGVSRVAVGALPTDLAEEPEPIFRKSPPVNVVRAVADTLESRCATSGHFAAYFESESDRMSKRGDPIRSFGFAITIAAGCSTSDLAPVVDGYGAPKEKVTRKNDCAKPTKTEMVNAGARRAETLSSRQTNSRRGETRVLLPYCEQT
jgi:hypothetical protein